MPEELSPKMKEQIAGIVASRRQARILSHAHEILKGWVVMTPGATPKSIADQAEAAMAAAEALYETSMTMKVPEPSEEPNG